MAGKAVYNEGRAVSYVWNEELFEEGLATVNYLLSIESLHEEQKTALRMYFKDGVDLYYSAPTGHGKSLVFQAIPVISDVLAGLAPLSSNILVITPLVSLMQDQVERIKKNTSVTAAAIFQDRKSRSSRILKLVGYTVSFMLHQNRCCQTIQGGESYYQAVDYLTTVLVWQWMRHIAFISGKFQWSRLSTGSS